MILTGGAFCAVMLLWGRRQPREEILGDTRIEILRMEDFDDGQDSKLVREMRRTQADNGNPHQDTKESYIEAREEQIPTQEQGTVSQEQELEMLEWGMPEGMQAEQMQQSIGNMEFLPRVRQQEISLEAYSDYQSLVKAFYTIDAGTMAGSDQLNVEALMSFDATIQKLDEPQILIYHTHANEAFADSIPGEESTTIVGVGDYLSQILVQDYGYQVMHCKNSFDEGTGVDAYANALPTISGILAENPTIQVVIDLHRDQMPENKRLVMDVDGRPTARFMFFNGISRNRKTGNIDYLKNENLDENLSFSFQMQKKAMEYYPGLTRKIYLKSYRYNMHLKERYLLIELGAQNNTVEEAMNACGPIAQILDLVLSGQ
ncbi:MAG: stage II sporulation protein P [Lachnospiraceae bacterium]|nr:stage II sporulation protein P [Lachnospiraceae bacterium]